MDTHNEGLINQTEPKLATAKYFGYWGSPALSEQDLSPYIALGELTWEGEDNTNQYLPVRVPE